VLGAAEADPVQGPAQEGVEGDAEEELEVRDLGELAQGLRDGKARVLRQELELGVDPGALLGTECV
jgi:hypothetical protein